jgi:hypothetical protein
MNTKHLNHALEPGACRSGPLRSLTVASAAFLVGISFTPNSRAQTTHPAARSLPVTENFGTTTFTALPSGFAAWNGLSGVSISTQALAEGSAPAGNATISAATAAQTGGGCFGYAAAANARPYLQTSSNATNGVNQLVMALNSSGRQDLVVGYDVELLSAQPRTVGAVCQYRIGTTGSWTTLVEAAGENPYSQAAGTTGVKTTVSATLPADASDKPVVQVRWATWRGTEAGNSSGLAIDNVSVSSAPLAADVTAPTISAYSPANLAAAVPVASNLVATFSEAVVAITGGTLKILRTADDSEFEVVTLPSAKVQTGATVTINPTSDLEPGIGYHVEISADALEDAAGNNFDGFTGSTVWSFVSAIPDVTPPAVVSYSPAVASTGIHPQANLVLTFDEGLVPLAGNIEIKKADDSPFESLAIGGPQVTVSGTTITINPTAPLEFNTGYHVNLPADAVADAAGNGNLIISGGSGWNFTTRLAPSVVISQTYEGTTAADHHVELKNLTGTAVALDGYRLAVWSDTAPSDNEGWKSGTGTTTRVISLDGFSIPANGHFLLAHSDSAVPAYAAANYDIRDSGFNQATFFDGDDSVVLYDGATNALDNIADAVSISANNAANISLYRQSDAPLGYDFAAESSAFAYPAVWSTRSLADVASATPTEKWYLSASQPPKTLTLEIDLASVTEGAGPNAAVATVTRTGPLAEELFFNITVSLASEIAVTTPLSFATGSATATFQLTALDDALPDGNRLVTITVQSDSYVPGSAQITVNDDGLDAVNVVINEVDADQLNTDANEFIELYNTSSSAQSLDGLVLVLFNGKSAGNPSYDVIDLSGHSIPANEYFVIGSASVAHVDLAEFVTNGIQNGGGTDPDADAIALYVGTPAEFPNGTLPTTTGLLDAVVYNNGIGQDPDLVAALTPLTPQLNENLNNLVNTQSIARVPNGGAAFDTTLFAVQAISPGATNILATDFDTWVTATGATGGMTGDSDLDGRDNAYEYAFGLNPVSSAATQPFVVPFDKATGVFTYSRRKQSLTGIAYTYEYHTTLNGAWTPFTPAVVPVSNGGDPVENITITVPAAQLAKPNLFIRVVTP